MQSVVLQRQTLNSALCRFGHRHLDSFVLSCTVCPLHYHRTHELPHVRLECLLCNLMLFCLCVMVRLCDAVSNTEVKEANNHWPIIKAQRKLCTRRKLHRKLHSNLSFIQEQVAVPLGNFSQFPSHPLPSLAFRVLCYLFGFRPGDLSPGNPNIFISQLPGFGGPRE